jgi:hypothetical protein
MVPKGRLCDARARRCCPAGAERQHSLKVEGYEVREEVLGSSLGALSPDVLARRVSLGRRTERLETRHGVVENYPR